MNALAREFRFFSLLRFAVPTIVMMLVLSFYTVVDGIFVSRFVGSNALSAVNIAMPLVNIVSGIGVMFATGGSAIVAKEMGENQEDRARGHFTLIVISSIVVGILFALVGFLFTGPIVRALGATELLYEDCYIYSYICLLFAPANIVKCLFDYFMVTAGKPQIGLANSVLGESSTSFWTMSLLCRWVWVWQARPSRPAWASSFLPLWESFILYLAQISYISKSQPLRGRCWRIAA